MEIDEADWQEAWQAMPNRRVLNPEKVDIDRYLKVDLGPVLDRFSPGEIHIMGADILRHLSSVLGDH